MSNESIKNVLANAKEELGDVNPIDDHNEKYNIGADVLAEANAKMVGKKKEKTVHDKERDMITHKRTDKQYKEIWAAFLEKEEAEFVKQMGYGKKQIKKIGFKKFIDAMDWRSIDEIGSYKKDAMHIIICPNCTQEFGIYEINIGLCNICLPKFDMERFWKTYAAVGEMDKNESNGMLYYFLTIPEFRNNYRHVTIDYLVDRSIEEGFKDIFTYRVVKHIIDSNICDDVDSFSQGLDLLYYPKLIRGSQEFFSYLGFSTNLTLFNGKEMEQLQKNGWQSVIINKMKAKLQEQQDKVNKEILGAN